MKKKKIVVPVEMLATAEEYVAGPNTFESNKGDILAVTVGQPLFDEGNREVDVKTESRKVLPLETGSIVLGVVDFVKESAVIISLFDAEKRGIKRVLRETRAALMVSKVSREYIKDLHDFFKIGDIVKAKVIKLTPYSIDLATDSPDLGVVKAFCTKCKQPLHLFGGQLKCLACGHQDTRKFSKDYQLK
jgi:exosome complex component CSL4